MSRVSILSSGNAAKASNSACCVGVSWSELPFFIGSPFMRGRLAGTNDAAHFFLSIWIGLRPGMHHEHDHLPNHADCLPAFFAGCVFHGCLPPSPSEGCHSVHVNAATSSIGCLPPSPR